MADHIWILTFFLFYVGLSQICLSYKEMRNLKTDGPSVSVYMNCRAFERSVSHVNWNLRAFYHSITLSLQAICELQPQLSLTEANWECLLLMKMILVFNGISVILSNTTQTGIDMIISQNHLTFLKFPYVYNPKWSTTLK